MRYLELFEIGTKKSNKEWDTAYKNLYHLTNYSGLVQSIFSNALTSKTQSYISTTYNAQLSGIVGRDFYDFKFVLDGKKLAKQYGVYEVSDYHYVGSEYTKMEEDEIGVDTDKIEPLSDYAQALVLLRNPFSRMFIQWLFYDSKTKFDNIGAHAIEEWANWNKPIYRQEKGKLRQLTSDEQKLLNKAIELGQNNVTFRDALSELADQFRIADHMSGYVSSAQVRRENKRKEVMQIINNTLGNRPIDDIEQKEVENMLYKVIMELGYDRSFASKLMKKIKDLGLNTPLVSPVDWSSLVRNLIKGEDWEEIVADLEFTRDEKLAPVYRQMDKYGRLLNNKHTPSGVA